MKGDDQRGERSNHSRSERGSAGSWRTLVIALLAARALSPHGLSADSGAAMAVSSHRICIVEQATGRGAGR
jgi:hypothetical protein